MCILYYFHIYLTVKTTNILIIYFLQAQCWQMWDCFVYTHIYSYDRILYVPNKFILKCFKTKIVTISHENILIQLKKKMFKKNIIVNNTSYKWQFFYKTAATIIPYHLTVPTIFGRYTSYT